MMYAAVLLNPITEAGAVAVGIIAAVVIVAGLGTGIGAAYEDVNTPDRLLYLAPDHKLSVVLRK